MKKISIIQWLAWFYAAMFLTVVFLGHIPFFTDKQGYLFGFYSVSPLIDVVHFFAGILAVIAAWHSTKWSVYYFRFAAIPFAIDVVVSFLFSRDLTETGSILYRGLGPADVSLHNIIANSPHIFIAGFALLVGFWLARKFQQTHA
ncbi:DUF4383 domain-containing protein [Candidatus Parcubacteria bacterium]|nr:DUF4383 domain-containing protein [Candidatus Parcubacteria bacterium]